MLIASLFRGGMQRVISSIESTDTRPWFNWPTMPSFSCFYIYISWGLSLFFLATFILTTYQFTDLLKQHRRRPQKGFLFLLGLESLTRAVYFALQPFGVFSHTHAQHHNDQFRCIPTLSALSTVLGDILGTFPTCFFIAAFSLYVITIARVNKLFSLHYDYYSPSCIVYFYRCLVGFIIFTNILSFVLTTLSLLSSTHHYVEDYNVICLSIVMLSVAMAFVWVVNSLHGLIEETIASTLHQQIDSQNQINQLSSTSSSSQNHDYLSSDINGNQLPFALHSDNMYTFQYDGDDTYNRSSSSYFPNSFFSPEHEQQQHLAETHNSPLLDHHTTTAAAFTNPSDRYSAGSISAHGSQEQPTTTTAPQDFSYGYQGRPALNPVHNPMRYMLYVAWLCCGCLFLKCGLLILLHVWGDSMVSALALGMIIFIYMLISEVIPIAAMLVAFRVVAAPTMQWRMTYEDNVPDNINTSGASSATSSPHNSTRPSTLGSTQSQQLARTQMLVRSTGSINSPGGIHHLGNTRLGGTPPGVDATSKPAYPPPRSVNSGASDQTTNDTLYDMTIPDIYVPSMNGLRSTDSQYGDSSLGSPNQTTTAAIGTYSELSMFANEGKNNTTPIKRKAATRVNANNGTNHTSSEQQRQSEESYGYHAAVNSLYSLRMQEREQQQQQFHLQQQQHQQLQQQREQYQQQQQQNAAAAVVAAAAAAANQHRNIYQQQQHQHQQLQSSQHQHQQLQQSGTSIVFPAVHVENATTYNFDQDSDNLSTLNFSATPSTNIPSSPPVHAPAPVAYANFNNNNNNNNNTKLQTSSTSAIAPIAAAAAAAVVSPTLNPGSNAPVGLVPNRSFAGGLDPSRSSSHLPTSTSGTGSNGALPVSPSFVSGGGGAGLVRRRQGSMQQLPNSPLIPSLPNVSSPSSTAAAAAAAAAAVAHTSTRHQHASQHLRSLPTNALAVSSVHHSSSPRKRSAGASPSPSRSNTAAAAAAAAVATLAESHMHGIAASISADSSHTIGGQPPQAHHSGRALSDTRSQDELLSSSSLPNGHPDNQALHGLISTPSFTGSIPSTGSTGSYSRYSGRKMSRAALAATSAAMVSAPQPILNPNTNQTTDTTPIIGLSRSNLIHSGLFTPPKPTVGSTTSSGEHSSRSHPRV